MCQENAMEDPWNTVAMAVCALVGLHAKMIFQPPLAIG
jgi:hypothetical protein